MKMLLLVLSLACGPKDLKSEEFLDCVGDHIEDCEFEDAICARQVLRNIRNEKNI